MRHETLTAGRRARLMANPCSGRAALVVPAPARMFDDGGVENRVRLVRPAVRDTMAGEALAASNWQEAEPSHWRALGGGAEGGGGATVCRETPMSDLHTLPDRPIFAFCPAYEPAGELQPIRLVFAGVPGYVPTALVALTLEDAERLCDRLNAHLGLARRAWTAPGERAGFRGNHSLH